MAAMIWLSPNFQNRVCHNLKKWSTPFLLSICVNIPLIKICVRLRTGYTAVWGFLLNSAISLLFHKQYIIISANSSSNRFFFFHGWSNLDLKVLLATLHTTLAATALLVHVSAIPAVDKTSVCHRNSEARQPHLCWQDSPLLSHSTSLISAGGFVLSHNFHFSVALFLI